MTGRAIKSFALAGLVILATSLTACFSPDAPTFYTCSTSQPSCPGAMVCIPISGLDSGILTDWKYERSPALCMPVPTLDKGATKPDAAPDTK